MTKYTVTKKRVEVGEGASKWSLAAATKASKRKKTLNINVDVDQEYSVITVGLLDITGAVFKKRCLPKGGNSVQFTSKLNKVVSGYKIYKNGIVIDKAVLKEPVPLAVDDVLTVTLENEILTEKKGNIKKGRFCLYVCDNGRFYNKLIARFNTKKDLFEYVGINVAKIGSLRGYYDTRTQTWYNKFSKRFEVKGKMPE